jgi:hypothetical protein
MSAAWGALQIAFPNNGSLYLLSALLFASLATGWAIWDAKSHGIGILPILQMLYFFVWPVSELTYLIYRSGIRGVLTATIHGIGLVATLAVTFSPPRYY